MNSNDHNWYISSFHHGMGLEHEELAFNSYFSPKHNNSMNNSNQNLYRPYDNDISKNNDGVNGGDVVHSAGSLGNRNVLGNNTNASSNLNEKISAGSHFPDNSYPYFQNANFWPQFSQHNNVSEPNAHDLRHPPPLSNHLSFCLSEDESNGSVYEIDVERSPLTSPDAIQTSPYPTMFPSDWFLSQQNHHPTFAPVSNDIHQKHQLPIRPIPQQANIISPTFPYICSECGRYCSSPGGLKRHMDFCHIIRAKLEKVDAINVEDAESYISPYSTVDARPLNLSSDTRITRAATNQAEVDDLPIQCEPMNFSVNYIFPGVPLSEENNNLIQNQSISEIPVNTTSKIATPTVVLTVLPIPDKQDPPEEPFVSNGVINERERQCPQCPLILRSERALIKHLVSHDVRQPFECKTCGKRFSRKFHMTRHAKQQGCDGSSPIQFECKFCGKHFSRKDNMHEHIKGHMGQNKKKIKLSCPVPMCERKFSGKTQLQTHLNIHSDSRPYNCNHDDCDKTFRSNDALRKHQHIHHHGKEFKCPQCDACFATKHSLVRHINSHGLKRSVKSYICCHCGLAFIHQTQLDDHVKAHLPSKTLECQICFRTYKRHWRLQKHYKQIHHVNFPDESNQTIADPTLLVLPSVEDNQATHPHACDKCPRKFGKRQALKSHYVIHFQKTLLACTECSCAYIRRDCLLRHLRIKHRLLPDEALEAMEKMNPRTSLDKTVASTATDVDFENLGSTSKLIANDPQESTTAVVGEIIDVSILESNISELLSLLVDPDVMRSFGWPNYSIDRVLQSVLVKCGEEPFSQPYISLAQRLRGNTQKLFSFLVDDQTALKNLFSRRPVEQVLEQVIELARNAGDSTNVVLLPL